MSQQIAGTVAFVTGANRGIGAALVNALIERGATKVYASARRAESLETLVATHGGKVVPVTLDVTNPDQIAAAVHDASDTRMLFNNAGVVGLGFKPTTDPGYIEALRSELDTNVVGLHAVTLAFAPVLKANGGGAIVNLSSVAAFANFFLFPTYSASKAAVHSLTQAFRLALRADDITVHGVYPGPVDTDMGAELPMEKTSPAVVANAILDGVAAGVEEILPDPMALSFGSAYQADPKALERQVAAMAAA
jgi:NAD(P)-dependent dehydrogenase (short-subunit alcohol dehydrogenase family)